MAAYPAPPDDHGRFVGATYSAILCGGERDALLGLLADERFTGWVGPPEEGWCAVVPERPLGHVARRRQRARDLAEMLATGPASPVVAVGVERDKVLRLWAGTPDGAVIDYVSDISADSGDDWTLDPFGNPTPPAEGPSGAERAPALARTLARPEVADELRELLLEDLGESTSESERLGRLAALLGWPAWIVAVDSLPRQIPGGPDRQASVRLRAGRRGVPGVLLARVTRVVRRRA